LKSIPGRGDLVFLVGCAKYITKGIMGDHKKGGRKSEKGKREGSKGEGGGGKNQGGEFNLTRPYLAVEDCIRFEGTVTMEKGGKKKSRKKWELYVWAYLSFLGGKREKSGKVIWKGNCILTMKINKEDVLAEKGGASVTSPGKSDGSPHITRKGDGGKKKNVTKRKDAKEKKKRERFKKRGL